MLIKHQALALHLRQRLAAVYVLFGQDYFLLNDAAEMIKSAWQGADKEDSEKVILTINSAADWLNVEEETNHYSLFANKRLIDIRYEKKNLDAAGKEVFARYLQRINPTCLLLLRGPHLTQKQLQGLVKEDNALLVQTNPLNSSAMQNWIVKRLQQKNLQFEQPVPALIQHYTQGNMLACAQLIDKLELIGLTENRLTLKSVQEQLSDQCDYQLFELTEACLSQNPDKVILLLRHAYHSKIEPTLVLWLLAQEIRVLIQLTALTTQQALPFSTACNQLKIWPQRIKLYQIALKNKPLDRLVQLLQSCKMIDEQIKSNRTHPIWQAIEQVALSLCIAKQVGWCA